MDDVTKARENLIARLVDKITQRVADDTRKIIDQDWLHATINAWLPLTYAEAEAAMDAEDAKFKEEVDEITPPDRKPSMIAGLREALGFGKEVSLVETVKGAVNAIKERDTLKKAATDAEDKAAASRRAGKNKRTK